MAATLSRRSTWSWEKYAESVWPERVVLDAAGFQASTALPNGRRSTRTQRAFSVLGAVGYPFLGAKPKVWALEAHGRENQAAWSSLLGSYAGTPELVVTDGGQHLINAVHTAFPRPGDPYPNVRRGEWHLGKNVRSTLPAEIANDPDHTICVALGGAFRSLDGWDRFVETAYAESGAPAVCAD
jgi:hypothetical protein